MGCPQETIKIWLIYCVARVTIQILREYMVKYDLLYFVIHLLDALTTVFFSVIMVYFMSYEQYRIEKEHPCQFRDIRTLIGRRAVLKCVLIKTRFR